MRTRAGLCALLFLLGAWSAGAATFAVTTSVDSGPGSLRAAIEGVNAEPGGTHTITFSGGPFQILLLSALPPITSPGTVTIQGDGSILDGYNLVGAEDGLRIETDNCTVSGLVINRFPGNGIHISGNGNQVRACVLGLDVSISLPNDGNGICIDGGANNVIGGLLEADRNIICASGLSGVYVTGSAAADNQVLNNYIGLDASGNARGNQEHGVHVFNAPGTQIGAPGRGNWVSGNTLDGLRLGGGVEGTEIKGNGIGTDITGFAGQGNGSDGIELSSTEGAILIGGTGASGNTISANAQSGIYAHDGGTGIVIQGNYLGTNVQGTGALANYTGITIAQQPDVVIGGTAPGEGNVISGNTMRGVDLSGAATSGCVLEGNAIGTTADGTGPLANDQGVVIRLGSHENLIGGDSVSQGRPYPSRSCPSNCHE